LTVNGNISIPSMSCSMEVGQASFIACFVSGYGYQSSNTTKTAGHFFVYQLSTANTGWLYGVQGKASAYNANVANAVGAYGRAYENTGVNTNAYSFYGGAASGTNAYGLYLESPVGTTLSYAIYTNSGAVRFGDDVTVNGDLTVTGTVSGVEERPTVTLTNDSASGAVALRFGATTTEGLEAKVMEETVSTSSGAHVSMSNAVPSGAVILCVQTNIEALVDGDGEGDDLLDQIAIGHSGDDNLYGESGALTQNTKTDCIPDWEVLSAARTIQVTAYKAVGAPCTEEFNGGSVRIRVVYLDTNSLDNA